MTPDTPPASPMRGLVLRLVIAVLLLHAVAIALYTALGIESAEGRLRSAFMVGWIVATLVVCSYFLRRIRLLRRGWRVGGG